MVFIFSGHIAKGVEKCRIDFGQHGSKVLFTRNYQILPIFSKISIFVVSSVIAMKFTMYTLEDPLNTN